MPDCAPARRRSRSLARTSSLEPLGAMPYPPSHPFSLCPFSRCDVRISSPAVLDPPPEPRTRSPGAMTPARALFQVPIRRRGFRAGPSAATARRPAPRGPHHENTGWSHCSRAAQATYISGTLITCVSPEAPGAAPGSVAVEVPAGIPISLLPWLSMPGFRSLSSHGLACRDSDLSPPMA
jgi:hypothetical protein